MKKIFTLLFLICGLFAKSQTILTDGDIVIVNLNSDDPDQLQWVPLVDLAPGTNIKFTDCGWTAANSFRSGEYCIQWTNTTTVTKGTLITFNLSSYPGTASTGTLAIYTGTVITSNGSGYSTSNDQVIVFQGTDATPTLIFAVYSKGAAGTNQSWDADATSTNNSANPGCSGVVVGGDNIVYNLDINSSKAITLAQITLQSNWSGNDATRQNYIGAYVLPVTLSSFTGSYTNKASLLKWTTGVETNVVGYAIERSYDGNNFTQIGFVNAAGVAEYSYIDASAKSNTIYYRLRIDGNTSKYSTSIKIITDATQTKLLLYPTPAKNELNATFFADEKAMGNIQIVDVSGKVLLQKLQQLQKGYNVLNFDISSLQGAPYIFKIVVNNKPQSAVFTKL